MKMCKTMHARTPIHKQLHMYVTSVDRLRWNHQVLIAEQKVCKKLDACFTATYTCMAILRRQLRETFPTYS